MSTMIWFSWEGNRKLMSQISSFEEWVTGTGRQPHLLDVIQPTGNRQPYDVES